MFTHGGQTMKATGLTIAVLLLGVTPVRAEHYETFAFGDTREEACEQVKSDLRDQALLYCNMHGAAFGKADYGKCRETAVANGRYKVESSVEFSCQPK